MANISESVKVDNEFQSLIPPLAPEELAQLEENLSRDGCRDPLAVWKGLLLDGHNRKSICDRKGITYRTADVDLPDRNAAMAWIIRNQFGRRNLTPFQRAELALKLEPLIAEKATERMKAGKSDPVQKSSQGKTREKIAKAAGVSHDTIHKAKMIVAKASEPVKEKLRRGDTTINKEYKAIVKAEGQAQRRAKKETIPADLPSVSDRCQLICSDISEVGNQVSADSVDWIITDPPYPQKFLPVFAALSMFSRRVLKPGGSALVMVGQSYLPQIIEELSKHLNYHWTLAYLTPGGQAVQLWDREVNTFWKPVLWFVKGKYSGDWIGDVCQSKPNDNDKEHHKWGQSESGMADIVDRFTYPGQIICDPFVGGGSSAVVAVKMNRKFIGIDIDAKAIETTQKRLQNA